MKLMMQMKRFKKSISIAMTALLVFSSVPYSSTVQAVAAGDTVLINEDFEGIYTDSATLDGVTNANATGTIAGFTSALSGSTISTDTVALVSDAALGSKALKFTQSSGTPAQTGTTTVGVKRDFDSAGLSQGQVAVEFDFSLSNVTKNGYLLQVLDASGAVLADIQNKNNPTGYSGAYAVWTNADGSYTPIGTSTIANGTGYHLKALLDLTNKTATYTLSKKSDSSIIGTLKNQPLKNVPAGGLKAKTILLATKSGTAASPGWTMSVDHVQVNQPKPAPAAPTGLVPTSGNAQVKLDWTTVTGATYYSVKRSQTSGGPYTLIATNLTGTVTTATYTDSSVSNGTKYFYVVTASDASSESVNSDEVSATPAAPVVIAAPASLTAAAGNAKVDLAWSSVSNATSYNVKRSTDGSSYATIASNVQALSYSDTAVSNGTTYYYVVTAVNASAESVNSGQASATPAVPALPAAPGNAAALAGNAKVSLTWNAAAGAASYHVKRSAAPGGPYTTIANVTSGTGYTDSSLTNGTTYYYVVSAVNGIGEGPDSLEVSAKPGAFFINDNFEASTLGDTPSGYVSIANAADSTINNITVINNNSLTNKYYSPSEVAPANNKSAAIPGNQTNVLWINDNANAGRRGGFTNAFTPVSGKSGLTAELSFMEPKIIGDSYPLELIDSSGKTVLSFSVTNLNALETINPGNVVSWYNLKFVADTGTNAADVYFNGKYRGNYKFATQDTNIAKIQARTAGSSTGSLYVDNVKVYQQATVTPQNLVTAGSNKTVVLTWNAASGADSYNVYRSTASGGPYEQVAAQVTSPTYTDTGLINKSSYYYVVTSVNAIGESEYSNEAKGYPNNVQAPAAAPEFIQTDIRDSQVSMSWSAVTGKDEDGTDVPTTYTLVRSTTPNGPFITVAQNLAATAYLDKNLNNGTTYYYQVTGQNTGGSSPSSQQLQIAPAAPLAAPVLVSAEPGNNKVDLSWSSVSEATYYSVKRSEVNGGPYTKVTDVTGGTSYSDTGARNGQAYYYVITAARAAGAHLAQESMISNQLKATPYAAVTGAPLKPTGFNAVANDGKVSLSWNAAAGATSYTVTRAAGSGGSYLPLGTTSQTSYDDTNVVNGTTYYYVLTANNGSAASPATDEVAALPAKVLTVDKNATSSSAGFGATLFNTIQSAVNTVSATNTERTVIYIHPGTYTEKLTISQPYVSLVGAGMDATTIVYGDYAGTSATTGQPGHTGNTFLSQTVKVTGDNFTASNLTIENSSGPRSAVAQAVALSLYSDKASFESVKLKGYQDTLYNGLNTSNKGRQYFHNSVIQGDVDFIFGEGTAVVMDNVKMVLVSNSGGGGHITAGAQKYPTDKGYVFLNSQIVDDASAQGVYDLGRGWKDYARVSFINTLIDSKKFLAEGWASSCAGSCITNYFSEYNSYGTGANPSARTISTQLTGAEASVTIPQIFGDWDPSVQVAMPKVQYLPTVSAASSNFDKNAAKQADINVTVQFNGNSLTSITNGATALQASDYKVTGQVVTLNKAYLAGLAEGTTVLNFNFGSISIPLTVNVINTDASDIGKQVLGVNDGWGSFTTGTSGGSKAAAANMFTVTKRSELIQALGGNNLTNATNATPKIIYISGTIDMNVDDNDNPVGMDYYKDPAYDFNAYLAAYDPKVWGTATVPSGPLETARAASEANQGSKVKINVGSNTTIVGLPGSKAKILGGNLMVQNVDNVIIRNIDFQAPIDYFPQWDPTDGDSGNWNSAFDSITVKGAKHIWIDHNTFSDGTNRDDYSVKYFGRQYQQHDGAMDITNASDLITVSYNYFHDHDKTTLIGGSDSYTADRGLERITFHHNYYQNVTQRAPRVRFGQVHIYNNYYEGTLNDASYPFLYSMGVGFESQIYAENNYFVQDAGTTAASLIQVSPGGTAFTDIGSILNGEAVQIGQSKGGLSPVSWKPTLFTKVDATAEVPAIVKAQAGADNQAAPSAPTNLIATGGSGQVFLQWSGVANAAYYKVKRSTTKGGAYTTVASNVKGTAYTDTGLTNGTTYYYVVTAANAGGESSASAEASAMPHRSNDNKPGSSGGTGGGSSAIPAPTVEPAKDGAQILNLPTVVGKGEDGKSTAQAKIEGSALTQLLEALAASSNGSSGKRAALQLQGSEPVGKLEIPAASLAQLVSKAPDAVLSLQYGGASYDLPLQAIKHSSPCKQAGWHSERRRNHPYD